MVLRRCLTPLALLALAACAQPQPKPVHEYAKPESKTEAQILEAATTPLSDLNIVRAEIPQTLLAALRAPYARPADATCEGIAAEIRALDTVLGADLDTPGIGRMRRDAFAIMLGPSTPLASCLFELGFDVLRGTVVEDPESVVRAVSQGAVTDQIPGVRRVCLFSGRGNTNPT